MAIMVCSGQRSNSMGWFWGANTIWLYSSQAASEMSSVPTLCVLWRSQTVVFNVSLFSYLSPSVLSASSDKRLYMGEIQ